MSTKSAVRFLDRTTPPHIVTLVFMAGISALAMNVFLPSLPGMAEYFAADYRLVQLSVALYLAVNAVLQLIIGPLSDRFGRRPVVLWGCIGFMAATLGCIFSPTIEVFLFFRMTQAVIVAGMVLSRAIVRDMVPGEQAASMIGYVTMGIAVLPMLAPAIGGTLDEIWGWRGSFWFLFTAGLAVFWLCYADLGETNTTRSASMTAQLRDYPELLTSPRFWGYSFCAALSAGAFFAYLGGAPFVGATLFEMNPQRLGFFFGAPAVGYMLGNFISGRYSQRMGMNRMINAGSLVVAWGMLASLLLFYAGIGNEYTFFGFMCFVGLGNGMVIPNATAGALSVRPHLAGTASGLSGAIMLAGGASLSALAGMLLTNETGPFPLLWLMLFSASLGIVVIRLIVRRERRLAPL